MSDTGRRTIIIDRAFAVDLDQLENCPHKERYFRLFQKYLEAKWEREAREHREAEAKDLAELEAMYPDEDD